MKTLIFIVTSLFAFNTLGLAGDLVALAKSSGVQGGLVVHLGCGAGQQTTGLRLDERYLVHGLDTSADNIQMARRNIRAANQYGPVSVDWFDG